MRRVPTGALLLLVAALAGCGREPAEDTTAGVPEPTVRDSAGVRIVENGALPTGVWRAGAEPLFTVGWAPSEPTFTWLQSGRILPDGGALIGDSGSGEIHRIGADGSVVGSWGRRGEGPGEYQRIEALLLRGDSIFVSDGRLGRVTVLSPDGDVRTEQLMAGTFLHRASAILADGRVLLVPDEGYSAVDETRPEWVFERQPILSVDLESGTADTLAELPHLRRWYETRAASPGPIQVKGRAGGFADGFAWARSDVPEVRWFDGAGRLVQVARWKEESDPVTPELRRRMTRVYEESFRSRDAEEGFISAQLARLEKELDRYDGPLPYWNDYLVDRLGNAWLHDASPLPRDFSSAWRVVARDGTAIGWVDLPDVVSVLDITDDRILAVRLDELDVPAAVMIELIKP